MNILNVSVVIPCFNSSETLFRCLKSIICQSLSPCEIVIVDDGSKEPVALLISLWQLDTSIPIKIIRQENLGAPAARNVGIENSRGRYIAFLDADDIWFPDKLKIQYKDMEENKLTVCGHGYEYEKGKSKIDHAKLNEKNLSLKILNKWSFVYGNPLFTPTVMVLKDDFSGFDERFRRVDDYKAWVENFKSKKCACIDLVLAAGFKPPIGHSGLTGSIDRMHEGYLDVLEALLNENKIKMSFYLIARMIEAVKLPIRRYRASKIRSINFN